MLSKRKFREYFCVLEIVILFITTQIPILINNIFSVDGTARINLAVLILVFAALWIFLYKIFIKRNYKKISFLGKRLLLLCSLYIFSYFILIIIRYLLWKRLTVSVSMISTLLLSVTFYMFFEIKIFSYRQMMYAITIFLSIINMIAAILFVCNHGVVRDSILMDFMGNINIYIALMLIGIPSLFAYLCKNEFKCKNLLIFLGNLSIAILMFVFSGSRSGWILLLLELIISYFILYKFEISKRKVYILLCYIIGIFIIIINLFHFSPETQPAVNRTFFLSYFSAFDDEEHKKEDDKEEVKENIENSKKSIEESEITNQEIEKNVDIEESEITNQEIEKNVKTYELSDPDNETPYPDGVVKSFSRLHMLRRTFEVLKKYWIWGTGRDAIFMWERGYYSTHNLVLDAVVCNGVFGALIYMSIICFPVMSFFRQRDRKGKSRKIYIVSFAVLFLYSMVEPIMSSKLLVELFVWGLYGAIQSNEDEI